jgi:hypothetical protein
MMASQGLLLLMMQVASMAKLSVQWVVWHGREQL